MTHVPRPAWLLTTINAVREVMVKRLEKRSLDAESEKEVQMALEELDVMWEELEGQAELLSRENDRYAEFFDYAPDAYIVTDAGGNVREANRAASELMRAPRSEILGRPLSEFVAEAERVRFLSQFVGMIVEPAPGAVSWRSIVQPAAGPPVEVIISVRGIPLKKSGVRGLCWLIRRAD
jgi:PAS domain S-box-containing protein